MALGLSLDRVEDERVRREHLIEPDGRRVVCALEPAFNAPALLPTRLPRPNVIGQSNRETLICSPQL